MTERPVFFPGVDGIKLAGTLAMPDKAVAKAPAMLLIPGSGPTDRDGNQLPALRTDLLKQIAELLATHGIATLRFDKRGIAASVPIPAGMPLEDVFTWEKFPGDTTNAFNFLCQQPEIDAKHVGILGHSEGGLIALATANLLKGTPAVLVLASTAGRTLDVVIHEQLVRLLKLQGATAEQTKFFLTKNDEIAAVIRKTGKVPGNIPPGLVNLYPAYLGKYFRGIFAANPTEYAIKYPNPVLILQGEKDVQVSPTADAPALDAALRHRHNDHHILTLVRGASHNLKLIKGASEPGFEGPVAPQALSALSDWLTAKLKSNAG